MLSGSYCREIWSYTGKYVSKLLLNKSHISEYGIYCFILKWWHLITHISITDTSIYVSKFLLNKSHRSEYGIYCSISKWWHFKYILFHFKVRIHWMTIETANLRLRPYKCQSIFHSQDWKTLLVFPLWLEVFRIGKLPRLWGSCQSWILQ